MFKGEDFVVDTKEILRFAKQHWSTVKSNPGGRWNGRSAALRTNTLSNG
jgi:hypothetical protein